jgi:cell division protein FtsA
MRWNGLSVTPRLKPISNRRSAIISVLDVGTTKIVCFVAELLPTPDRGRFGRRSHQARVIGFGHQQARGIKAGNVVDIDQAEQSIRLAISAAEQMAQVEIRSVIVNFTGGRLQSTLLSAELALQNRAVTESDVQQVCDAVSFTDNALGRSVLHALPMGFSVDSVRQIRDPRGMLGKHLSVDMHVLTSEEHAVRNLMLAVEKAHVGIETIVASPLASGLACLVDDELDMGAIVVDLGGGTTSFGVFANGMLTHADAIVVGANHITMDIARGFSTGISHAERLKTRYGSALSGPSDERETIAVASVDEALGDRVVHVPRSQLITIIRPRIEEILELVRGRLIKSGVTNIESRNIILTGGGAGLTGIVELSQMILSKQVRVGRPLGVLGLPDIAQGSAFSTSTGLLAYPQLAALDRLDVNFQGQSLRSGTGGYFIKMGRWFRESF